MKVASAWIGAALLLGAQVALAETVVLRPGLDEGVDTSPYQFIPTLPRGNYDKLYAFSDPEHSFESFLFFELPPDLVGPDEVVSQALLALYYGINLPPPVAGEGGSDEPGVAECRAVLSAWNEGTLTWSNKPAYGPVVDSIENITELGTLLFDVTDVVANWAYGWEPNHGLAITSPTARLLGFYSFEANQVLEQYRPALIVTVEPGTIPEPDAPEVAALFAFAALLLARSRGRAV